MSTLSHDNFSENNLSPKTMMGFPNSLALHQEKHRRRKLSRLYTEQAAINDQLRDENESLHAQ